MKAFVKVKAGAKEERVEELGNGHFAVWVKERPVNGRANKAATKALAGYFKIGISNIKIISGHKSRQKIIKIYGK